MSVGHTLRAAAQYQTGTGHLMINSDDIIALLEDGPKAEADLIDWLGQPMADVLLALKALNKQGIVRRVGSERLWTLTGALPAGELPRAAAKPALAPGRRPSDGGPAEVGWWVQFAAPDQRDAFAAAARDRNIQMSKTDGSWRRVNIQSPKGLGF